MKNIHRGLVIFIVILMAAAFITGGCFVMQSYYAAADFAGGTWINGIYCAGKSIEEVNSSLLAERGVQEIVIYDREGSAYPISAALFGAQPDEGSNPYTYEEDLKKISKMQKEKTGFSLFHMLERKEYEAAAVCETTVQVEELTGYITEALPVLQDAIPREQCRVKLLRSEEGYIILDEKANYLDVQKAALAVCDAILCGRQEVDLEAEGCYENLAYTQQEREMLQLWEKIRTFQNASITYLFGEEKECLDASVRCQFIALTDSTADTTQNESMVRDGAYEYTKEDFLLDETGALQTDREAIEDYVRELAAKYDTFGRHTFSATRGDTITIEGGTYGNQLDQKQEADYLQEACLLTTPQIHEPIYKHKALWQGTDDIGDTYIEVDMGQQIMYYYEDAEMVLETPIVTGNTGRRMGTPARVCYVYNKQRNRILRGPDYASKVKYWMPVNGNIGIHDASWRNEFGGEIYKTNGSHGCINTPEEAMVQLYEMVEIGTPVVMFY